MTESTEPTDPLQVLTELYEASTQGDWNASLVPGNYPIAICPSEGNEWTVNADGAVREVSQADAEWIAESRNLFPALKEQVERAEKAEAEVKRLRELAQEINNNVNMALAGQIQNDDALANIDELVGAALAESQEKK